MKEIILATHNEGKVRELKELLAELPIVINSLLDYPKLSEIAETGGTFRENARIKARAVFAYTGLPTIADDSGLEVDALNGEPGVYSARYAGEEATDEANNQKLLQALVGVPAGRRSARFRSVICAVLANGQEIYTEGTCEGQIAFTTRGDNGFGYDPLFLAEPDFQRTMAELSLKEKNAISHRARAFGLFKPILIRLLGEGKI